MSCLEEKDCFSHLLRVLQDVSHRVVVVLVWVYPSVVWAVVLVVAVEADRQATVASSGLYGGDDNVDADSPDALFGDAAPKESLSATTPDTTTTTTSITAALEDGFDNQEAASFSITQDNNASEESSSWFENDDTSKIHDNNNNDGFGDDTTQFSTSDNGFAQPSGSSEESSFHTGDFGSGVEEDAGGSILETVQLIWDFFNGDD